MRSRERSSSQTATPASDSWARFSFCAISVPSVGDGPAAGSQREPASGGGQGVLRLRSVIAGGGAAVDPAAGDAGAGGSGVAGGGGLDALLRRRDDGVVGEAELLVEHGV